MSKLPNEVNLIIAFSTRRHGNMSLYYGATVQALDNRRNFLSGLGIDYRDLVCARQIHASDIRYVTESDKGSGAGSYGGLIADTDGFVTDKKNIPVAVCTADCLAVFIYDPKNKEIQNIQICEESYINHKFFNFINFIIIFQFLLT